MASNLNAVVVVLLAVATLLHGSAAHTKHVVGDSTGWTIPSGGAATFAIWAADKTFTVGDTLVQLPSEYTQRVEEVTKEDFESCNSASPLATYNDNPPVRVTLNKPGPHYFICGVIEHCSQGQKLAINVVAATATKTPSSSTATPPSSTATSPSSATFFSPPSPAGAGAVSPHPPHKSGAASLGLLSATLLSIVAAFF